MVDGVALSFRSTKGGRAIGLGVDVTGGWGNTEAVTVGAPLAAGGAALEAGRWEEARTSFEAALAESESAEAFLGLASARWWLGDNEGSVAACTRAYALFRQASEVEGAVQCALWLGITYKANFSNFAAANGWIGRAERLLGSVDAGALEGYACVARAYRMTDLEAAAVLTRRAVEVARTTEDVDLELTALSQLGLIGVGQGNTAEGFALIDEAMAAVLGGERSTLDTVVYTCCDMLNACELASDVERAAQWCQAADDFVNTYGSPFLYAECRIAYGSVLTAKGRWAEAERELDTGLRITEGACPALHNRALTCLADLRVRQGRLEEADQLLAQVSDSVEAEATASLSTAALALARGDPAGANRLLGQRLRQLEEHRSFLCRALDVLVDASLALGDVEAAEALAERLATAAAPASSDHLAALAHRASGCVAAARGEQATAVAELEAAHRAWSDLDLPYDVARTRVNLADVLAPVDLKAATEHLSRALAVFDDLGAAADADQVAALLRSLGVTPRPGPKTGEVLTAREEDVLRLLGAGLSNPEIAERLHISRKTAAHHVSRILAKLHLRNRAEAAAHAVSTRGQAPDP